MSVARLSLGLAALLLFATAALHASGATMVSGWLPGQRGAILDVLWVVPVIDWAIIGVLWLFVAWRDERPLAPLVWISAVVPLLVAILLIKAVGVGHPGIWMLIAAALLACVGAALLGRRAEERATA